MEHLADISFDELHQALESVDDKTPTLRLVAAIAYKHGITQSELAEWFDVERKTIYNWLTRLDDHELDSAVRDAPRGGRPRKLRTDHLKDLQIALHNAPPQAEHNAPVWTTALLQEYIREEFGVDYSRPSCRRLLREAGLRPTTTRQAVAEMDPDDREVFNRKETPFRHVWMPD